MRYSIGLAKKRVSIEAGSSLGWQKFVGEKGLIVGIDHYGASAPANVLCQEFGFTVSSIKNRLVKFISEN